MKFPTKADRIATFHQEIRALGFTSYSEYLRGEHWSETKTRFRASKLCRHQCAACGARNVPMLIHHKTYKRIGREYLGDLVEVCRACHAAVHQYEENSGKHLWEATNKVVRKSRKGIWKVP